MSQSFSGRDFDAVFVANFDVETDAVCLDGSCGWSLSTRSFLSQYAEFEIGGSAVTLELTAILHHETSSAANDQISAATFETLQIGAELKDYALLRDLIESERFFLVSFVKRDADDDRAHSYSEEFGPRGMQMPASIFHYAKLNRFISGAGHQSDDAYGVGRQEGLETFLRFENKKTGAHVDIGPIDVQLEELMHTHLGAHQGVERAIRSNICAP